MIRKLLTAFSTATRLLQSSVRSSSGLRIIPREQHGISRDHINPCALKVTSGLQEAGYSAFIVGGAARDLILGLEPKDFDVATNATPEEVGRFSGARALLGAVFGWCMSCAEPRQWKFRLFAAAHPAAKMTGCAADTHADEHGRLLHDNVFGSQEEDAQATRFYRQCIIF